MLLCHSLIVKYNHGMYVFSCHQSRLANGCFPFGWREDGRNLVMTAVDRLAWERKVMSVTNKVLNIDHYFDYLRSIRFQRSCLR